MAKYANAISNLVNNPDSFGETAGFKFARDQALQGVDRSAAARGMRGSGNVLAELVKQGTGMALQGRGDEIDRLGRLEGQEQQYALGVGANENTATRNANDLTLGTRAANTADTRTSNDFTLGTEQNANARRGQDLDFGLGMERTNNEYDVNMGNLDATKQRDLWNYDINKDQIGTTRARDQNDFNLNNGRLDLDWFNADTNRGTARSLDFGRQGDAAREWQKLNPPRRYA
jgi:hypothetical protein